MKKSLGVIFITTVLAAHATAQKSFDVISVKPNDSGNGPSDLRVSPQRFSWTNASLRQLIQVAYDVRPYQLIALPAWADGADFDVAATTGVPASPQQMNVMLQSLLADRFELVAHRDQRDLPAYAIVVARRDGKLGPGIHPSAKDCESAGGRLLDSAAAQAEYAGCSPQMGLTKLKLGGYSISFLAGGLKRILEKPVVDKTGLTGTFDMELMWTPDPTMLPSGIPAPTNVPSGGPSIFTALEEQLGLKLVSDRAPVDVLVIDHLSRPKPD
jgi:uncharacterized protein (TIGR03435 family)